ncbi:MAG: MBL fold metallo-hydrolase [Clostridia bacterium]|nr:MBL fold metallo-hydrolase [Clostridia bacterium]MBQ7046723.1 MBL fold metallo-hydrolase [Oscillospiraceae bacterium]
MTKNQLAKKIATWVVMTVMISVFLLDIICVMMCNHYVGEYVVETEDFSLSNGDDRIHFLNVNNSDAILLESNGKFALIDSGEGDNNPRRFVAYDGNEAEVIKYLKKVAADKNGQVVLDFVLGTHNHYDHIGAFEAIINDSDISAKTAYLKPTDPNIAHDYEIDGWGIQKIYENTVAAFVKDGIKVTDKIPGEIMFGDFKLTLYNTATDESLYGQGENAASVGVLVEKGERSAFLAADITRTSGSEELVIPLLDKVDILKVGHHGYYGSTSWSFAKKLDPDIAIITNKLGKIYPDVKWTLTTICNAAIFATVDENGIIATFSDDGQIILTNHAQDL